MEEQITATISSCYAHVSDAYDKLEEMGATMPEHKNIENLEPTLRSLFPTPVNEWGKLYTTEYPNGVLLTEDDYIFGLPSPSNASPTTQLSFSFGNVALNTITGFEFGSLPDYIDSFFLSPCPNLTYLGEIPANITRIATFFLRGASSFVQPLTIPSTITSIRYGFMLDCSAYTGPLTVECPGSVIQADYSLASSSTTAPMYVQGIKIEGSEASSWKAQLPNGSYDGNTIFRKLV